MSDERIRFYAPAKRFYAPGNPSVTIDPDQAAPTRVADPPLLAPYKLAQRELKARLQRRRYLSVDGIPAPDGPYVLREQQKAGQPTGVRKMVRRFGKDRPA